MSKQYRYTDPAAQCLVPETEQPPARAARGNQAAQARIPRAAPPSEARSEEMCFAESMRSTVLEGGSDRIRSRRPAARRDTGLTQREIDAALLDRDVGGVRFKVGELKTGDNAMDINTVSAAGRLASTPLGPIHSKTSGPGGKAALRAGRSKSGGHDMRVGGGLSLGTQEIAVGTEGTQGQDQMVKAAVGPALAAEVRGRWGTDTDGDGLQEYCFGFETPLGSFDICNEDARDVSPMSRADVQLCSRLPPGRDGGACTVIRE